MTLPDEAPDNYLHPFCSDYRKTSLDGADESPPATTIQSSILSPRIQSLRSPPRHDTPQSSRPASVVKIDAQHTLPNPSVVSFSSRAGSEAEQRPASLLSRKPTGAPLSTTGSTVRPNKFVKRAFGRDLARERARSIENLGAYEAKKFAPWHSKLWRGMKKLFGKHEKIEFPESAKEARNEIPVIQHAEKQNSLRHSKCTLCGSRRIALGPVGTVRKC